MDANEYFDSEPRYEQNMSIDSDDKLHEDVSNIKEDVAYLKDLFLRRLNVDKQKAAAIKILAEGATFAYIEPFLYDIILLLDRLEKKQEDDFVDSVLSELYSIINRRGVSKITDISIFDPARHKAVSVIESSDVSDIQITQIIRSGYEYSGKVIRPVEVIVVKPKSNTSTQHLEGCK